MIQRSAAIAMAAILLSLLVHLIGLNFAPIRLTDQPTTEPVTDVVEMGRAFEQFAEPVTEPVPTETAEVAEPQIETPIEPEAVKPPPEPEAAEPPPEPDLADTPTSNALVASVNPQRVFAPDTGVAPVTQPDATGTGRPEDAHVPEPETVEPSGGDDGKNTDAAIVSPVEPDTVAEVPQGDPNAALEPVEATTIEAPVATVAPVPQRLAAVPVSPTLQPSAVPIIPLGGETIAPEAPDTTIEPEPESRETAEAEETQENGEPTELAVATSLRPRLPNRDPSAEPLGASDGSPDFSNLRVPPSQVIESPLTVYQRDGVDLIAKDGGGRQSSGLGFSDFRGPGNSDVTNYAGQVLVHLNRAPVVHVSGRGFARVFFQINPDGTLAWVEVIDSTGSQEIDSAAKAQVRVAAPFPRPPNGASRKLAFVYRIN